MSPVLIAVITVACIGAVCAIVLVIAGKFMAVPVDEKFPKIRECLPGANCGGCGYAGCDGYAQALVDGSETKINLCIPGADAAAHELADIMGVAFEDVVEMCAYVRCNGNCENAGQKYDYEGIDSCYAAHILYNGKWSCHSSCLGYGDCERSCPNNAIHVVNGVAKVFPELCSGCGICARQCPQHIIDLRKQVDPMIVRCNNHDKGPIVMKGCKTGCIGCGLCTKNCPNDAIHLVDNLAVIDYDKCTACGLCAEKCPRHIILKLNL